MLELPPELIEAILADPESDAPRLVAADWFDENGDAEQAELIRHQCAHTRAKLQRMKAAERNHLLKREGELVQTCVERWFARVGLPMDESWRITFHRGFIYAIDRDVSTLAEVTAFLEPIPLVESLDLGIRGTLLPGWTVPFSRMRNLRALNLVTESAELTWEDLAPLTTLARLQRIEITSNETGQPLISPPMREQFRQERERVQSQVTDESARIAAVRARLGTALRSTTSGLDWLQAFVRCEPELRLAAMLPSLRRVQGWLNSDQEYAALAGLTQIRSLKLEGHEPETFSPLASLTNLREVMKPYWTERALPIFVEWLRTLPDLESLSMFGMMNDGVEVLRQLSRCPSLRILHLTSVQVNAIIPKDVIFPEVTELNFRPQSLGTTEWIDQFPKLRVISAACAIPRSLGLAYRERGIDFPITSVTRDLGPPLALERATAVELPHGIHLRVPLGLERIESPQSPYPQGSDIELIAAWQEFGPGDEWPDLRTLGPTRVWLERIAAPAGTQNAREWLTRTPVPFEHVAWGKFIRIESQSPIPPRVIKWTGMLHGLRAVWIGKHHILRMVCEYSAHRITSWEIILQGMIATVRVPKKM